MFGKISRFPGDLFSDERATTVHGNHLISEELRCQALKIIAEMRASSVIHPPPSQATRLVDEAKNILPGALPLLEVGEDERGPGLEDESAEPDVMGVEDALLDDPYLTLPDESTGSTTISITCDHTSRGVFTDLQPTL